jgi:hypothetical protein
MRALTTYDALRANGEQILIKVAAAECDAAALTDRHGRDGTSTLIAQVAVHDGSPKGSVPVAVLALP